jgi:response regulator RpfG family c-di-GMP phosphodiesterase
MKMKQFNVVDWMYERGHVSYRNTIEALQATQDEIRAEGGRYALYEPSIIDQLVAIDRAISEVYREAEDRYMDWATD